MIATLLQLAGVIAVSVLLARAALNAEKKALAKLAERRQAKWDAHVDQAVRISATPLYERIAQEFAKDLDEEWLRASRGEWGTA